MRGKRPRAAARGHPARTSLTLGRTAQDRGPAAILQASMEEGASTDEFGVCLMQASDSQAPFFPPGAV